MNMDNPLTPKKIQRLIHLAEDKSFNIERRLLNEEDVNLIVASQIYARHDRSYANNGESSSGILDLDRIKAFGESDIGGILSLSKSTTFIPGEMSGRSTGAEQLSEARAEPYGRHSLMLDTITKQMDKQTAEVNDVMRHSIATNFSLHSKRDLTADEQSLIAREAPIPVQQSYISVSENGSNTDLSVGAYFKNRCPDFGIVLGRNESPDRSNIMPSITEVSSSTRFDICKETNQIFAVDDTLDSVPVRQPRSPNKQRIPEPKRGIQKIPEPVIKVLNKPEISKQGSPAKSEKKDGPTSRIPPKSVYINPAIVAHKSFMTSSKPADVVLKNLHSSIKFVTEDTEGSVENSFSLSKIADYLGKQSNVSITDMLQLQKKGKKQPLTELNLNTQTNEPEVQVTTLKDLQKTETASSAGTLNTVISIDKLKLTENVPEVIVTQATGDRIEQYIETPKRATRSKSPSSKSQSTLSTVRENMSGFKSGDSPTSDSPGEANQVNLNRSKVPSPNIEYKELDMSVDWQDVLQQKRLKQQSLAKEKWAEIETASVNGFVGVMATVKIAVTTLTDSWITGKFEFNNLPNEGIDLTYELPRLPLLLSPKKTDYFVIQLTSSVEMRAVLPYTICLKDTALDAEVTQKGTIQVNFKLPTLQAISSDGDEKVTFPMSHEKAQLCKSFILASDCPDDLQLQLSVTEGDSIFSIKSVQEIKKTDINKVLMEQQVMDDQTTGKSKSKALSKQLCRLAQGNAIKVTILLNAPSLLDLQIDETTVSFSGVLSVNLFGVATVLTRVELVASVGRADLVVNVSSSKLCLTHEPVGADVINMGSLPGCWLVKMKVNTNAKIFKVNPHKFELVPGATLAVSMSYGGNEDIEGTIIFEEAASGTRTILEVVGIAEKNTSFPIKTNHLSMSWVRPGRKEVSFKSWVDKKIQIRCHIIGDGFSLDLPGGESRGVILPFSPSERRQLPIVFSPNTGQPCIAILQLTYDKTSNATRTIKLYGCASGECVRWSGLVTYGDTALVRACYRAPVELKLYNRANSPAFIYTSVHFNLQYRSCESSARLVGGRCVIPPRAHHRVSLRIDWVRVEGRAREGASTALGALSVLCGAEYTRRRLLRIITDNGVLDTSLLPDHLKVLASPFEGEDPALDEQFRDFNENKASLNELISGLQELTAQIDLPQDFADENSTIILTDDTLLDHKTICD